MLEPIKIFYYYAPQDRNLRDDLEKHLMVLKRLGQITLRLNREILAGANWSQVEDQRFQGADLILLLISPDLINSDYHYGTEMRHVLERHEAGNVRVVPIILRPTALWEKTPIGKLQALPKNGKAITSRRNRDVAFVEVVKEISEIVAILLARKQELAFATKASEGEFPKFTQVIGPLCPTCGARNPLEGTICENCGDLLLENIANTSQDTKVETQYPMPPISKSSSNLGSILQSSPPQLLTNSSTEPATSHEKGVSKRPSLQRVRPQSNTLFICFGHTGRITALAWSPNSKYLASASYDKSIKVWDAATGCHMWSYGEHRGRVHSLSYSPNSKYLVSVSDDSTAHILEAATGKQVYIYREHVAGLLAVAWSPNDKYIASAGRDNTFHIWDPYSYQQIDNYDQFGDIYCLAWSSNGRYLASGSRHELYIRDVEKRNTQLPSLLQRVFSPYPSYKKIDGSFRTLTWCPDNKRIALVRGNYDICIYNIRKNTIEDIDQPWKSANNRSIINSIVWSPDGDHLAIGGNDKVVHILNANTGKEILTYNGHTGYIMSIVWSPDRRRLASAGVDRTFHTWLIK